MNHNLFTTIKGTMGITFLEVGGAIMPTPTEIEIVGKLILQGLITLVTIIAVLRENRKAKK